MKIVEVTWSDAGAHPHWQEEGDVPKPVTCRTVGYLLRARKRYIVLAETVTKDRGGTMSPLAIPKGCITKIRRLQ